MLKSLQPWRISAEISHLAGSGYRDCPIWTSLARAAGPSNTLLVAEFKYRYPSASRRSVHSLDGPLALRWFGRRTADFAACAKKPFAARVPGGDCSGANNSRKANRACKRKPGLAQSSPWSRLRRAVTPRLNKSFMGQGQVLLRQFCWVAIQPPVRFLALVSTFTAKPHPSSAEQHLSVAASGGGAVKFGHRGFAPVAGFDVICSRQWPARTA